MLDITEIFQAVISLIISVIATFLIPYLKRELDEKTLKNAQIWVKTAVMAAEQVFNETGMGERKKAYVAQFLQGVGLKLDFDRLDALIEASVSELNAKK